MNFPVPDGTPLPVAPSARCSGSPDRPDKPEVTLGDKAAVHLPDPAARIAARLGDYDAARIHCEAALALQHTHRDPTLMLPLATISKPVPHGRRRWTTTSSKDAPA